MTRERDFYKNRNLPNPKDLPQNTDDDAFPNESHADSDYHRYDEQVTVSLECTSNNLNALKRRFLRCSSQATITHLKKFVAKKVLDGIDKYKEVSHSFRYNDKRPNKTKKGNENNRKINSFAQVDILCNDELLGKDHTLKFVYVTRWRFRDPPLRLQFRPRIDL